MSCFYFFIKKTHLLYVIGDYKVHSGIQILVYKIIF